ncbi:hypothetical protein FB382_003623 [Nocardioides ginsengisegetis]|uniref:EccD-like transmembrane domain-containing protein n=1 Tax=Nocardioides ginsengisegetis TaxID=661491 RepID=A0A7W3PBB9_9ACTN|nr:hypothetical protein [Nocardioides ginsengisegetis]MBA8805332.1 hypothetical protein [Nocardioides ginsengisegetis]
MAAATGGSLALSVHGPLGVLDLLVPAGAAATDVAREYAEQSGLAAVPVLYTRLGQHLQPDVALADVGIGTGSVLVATTEVQRLGGSVLPRETHPREDRPGPLSVVWFAGAVVVAVLAAWFAARSGSDAQREATVLLLVAAAVVGVVPLGRYAAHRLLAVPAYAGSAAFVLAWDPQPARIPTVLGVAALVAAVAAAVARTLDRRNEEALKVWVTVGVAVFAVTGLAALLGFPPRVPWALLLVAAMLAARFVPGFAVDVPDQYLIDLERLAVNAWSARERATGRRGRSVVPPSAVATVAARGTRIVTAYAVAILAVTSVSAPLLLGTATLSLDRVGARCLVLLCGCGLVLAGRSYRHAAARALLRTAGLVCWSAVLVSALASLRSGAGTPLAGIAITTAVAVLVAAVATGRGWRSAWWSRRAEIAEALCGSAAVASVLVATGVFRAVWESIHMQV